MIRNNGRPAGNRAAKTSLSGGFNSPTSLSAGIDSCDRSPLRQQVDEAIAANGTKITMKDLTVLAPQNDPFRIDRPSAHRDGEWLAVTAERLGLGKRRIHLRGLHDMIIGQTKPDGSRYINTDKGWMWLQSKAAAVARWLGHMTFAQMPILVARRLQAVVRCGGQADWRHGVETFADLDDVVPRRSEIACDWGSIAALADKLMVVGTMTGAEVVDVSFKAKCGRRLVAR